MEAIQNTILIIEDDLGLNELISEKIQECGFQTYSVMSVADAINWLTEHSPTLMVVDYSLSDMTAKNFIEDLRSKGISLVPFIIATGQGDERIAVEMMKLGARDYIVKDTNLLELLPTVIGRVTKEIQNENKLKLAEKELKESDEKYRLLLENSGIGVGVYDLEGNLQFHNQKALQNLGGKLEDFIGKSFIDVFGEAVGTVYHKRIQDAIKSEISLEYEDYFESVSGNFWFLSNHTRIKNSNDEIIGVQVLAHDITERKLAQLEVERIGKHYQSIIENAPDGFVLINSEGNFKYVSPSGRRIFGYDLDEEINSHPDDSTHPDDLPMVLSHLMKLIEDPSYIAKVEYRFAHKDGHWIWIESTFTNMLSDPNVESIVINFRDISERKQAEEALFESERRFSLFMDHLPATVFLKDNNGKTLYVNKYMNDALGASQWIGKDMFEIFPNEFGEKLMADDKKAIDIGYLKREEIIQHLDNVIHTYETQKFIIPQLGKEHLLGGIALDVTERKQISTLLENERALYLDLVNTQPAGIYRIRVYPKEKWENNAWINVVNPPYKIELVSQRFCEILEIGINTFESYPGILFDLIHPDDKAEFVRKNEEANTLIKFFSWDCRLLINNKIKWVHFESIPRKLDNGEILFTGIIYDINDQKLSQEKLLDSEMRFRKLLQDIQTVSVQGYAPDGTTQYWNKASERLYGYTAEEAIGKNLIDLIIPTEMRIGVKQAMEQMAETGQPIPAAELLLMRKDGTLVSVFSNHTIVEVAGQTQELFCIDIDLTEMKQAQEALRESERVLLKSQQIAQLGSYSWDIVKGYWTSSAILDDIFGIDENYIRSTKGWVDLIHPEWQDIMSEYITNDLVLNNQRFDKEYKIIRKDNGQECWVHGLGDLEFDSLNQPITLIGTISNINQRKLAELAILENEAKMKKVLIESSILIDINSENTDYQKITNTILDISGAKYVSFDVVNDLENKIQTYALSGVKENILKISSMLGFEIVNKKWNNDPVRAEKIKHQIVNRFNSMNEITASQIPVPISKLIEKTFNLGEVVIVKIAQKGETVAFFTLFFLKEKALQNTALLELFANQVGLYMERKKAEEALIKKMNEMEYFQSITVGRELKMIELKKEINKLLNSLGKENKYIIVE